MAMILDYRRPEETRLLTLWLLALAFGLGLAVFLAQSQMTVDAPANAKRPSTEFQLEYGIAEGAQGRER